MGWCVTTGSPTAPRYPSFAVCLFLVQAWSPSAMDRSSQVEQFFWNPERDLCLYYYYFFKQKSCEIWTLAFFHVAGNTLVFCFPEGLGAPQVPKGTLVSSVCPQASLCISFPGPKGVGRGTHSPC